jgi:phosphate butyryltransferase
MFRSFYEVEQDILLRGRRKRIALAGAHDEAALSAVVDAHRRGVVDATLVGDETQIRALLSRMGEDEAKYTIIGTTGDSEASKTAVSLVREGEADIEMKGNLPSADFLLPIMNPLDGLVDFGSTLSEATVFEYQDQHRLMFATDCALTIAPNLKEKVALTNNAVELARAFGFNEVKVAAISALERVNPQIPNTQEADELSKMEWPRGVVVAGPFALDNALDAKTARHKGIDDPVAGCADVLLMPDLTCGNVFHKCVHYLGHLKSAAVVCGTTKPVVFTSRSDSAETKYLSILSAILQSIATEG